MLIKWITETPYITIHGRICTCTQLCSGGSRILKRGVPVSPAVGVCVCGGGGGGDSAEEVGLRSMEFFLLSFLNGPGITLTGSVLEVLLAKLCMQ